MCNLRFAKLQPKPVIFKTLGYLFLRRLVSSLGLQVLEGDKVVEVKNIEVNKGIAAFRFISKNPEDLHLAIGDDWTDEDTFSVMPDEAIAAKVGHAASKAKYHLDTVGDVREFLKRLIL